MPLLGCLDLALPGLNSPAPPPIREHSGSSASTSMHGVSRCWPKAGHILSMCHPRRLPNWSRQSISSPRPISHARRKLTWRSFACRPPLARSEDRIFSFIVKAANTIASHSRPGQLVILQSTTFPGTTRETLAPIFMKRGLTPGRDIFLAFSPERLDPGNNEYNTSNTPKVVGADDPTSLELASNFFSIFVDEVIPVSSSDTAEAVKLTENIFRQINVSLVNELKILYTAMGVDIWEVIAAAQTKPFGYMPFYPGPGIGGHCIPVDPPYLAWKAREFGLPARFIELADEINIGMPNYVISRLAEAIGMQCSRGLKGTSILIAGVAYKKNVNDYRESPALPLIRILKRRGAKAAYYDPFISEIPQEDGSPAPLHLLEVPQQSPNSMLY